MGVCVEDAGGRGAADHLGPMRVGRCVRACACVCASVRVCTTNHNPPHMGALCSLSHRQPSHHVIGRIVRCLTAFCFDHVNKHMPHLLRVVHLGGRTRVRLALQFRRHVLGVTVKLIGHTWTQIGPVLRKFVDVGQAVSVGDGWDSTRRATHHGNHTIVLPSVHVIRRGTVHTRGCGCVEHGRRRAKCTHGRGTEGAAQDGCAGAVGLLWPWPTALAHASQGGLLKQPHTTAGQRGCRLKPLGHAGLHRDMVDTLAFRILIVLLVVHQRCIVPIGWHHIANGGADTALHPRCVLVLANHAHDFALVGAHIAVATLKGGCDGITKGRRQYHLTALGHIGRTVIHQFLEAFKLCLLCSLLCLGLAASIAI
eukprot:m.195867 g.195867  ORF g.195867 m.195867 type:complete len:368 (-) comp19644_c0_seq1:2063-3166(-)